MAFRFDEEPLKSPVLNFLDYSKWRFANKEELQMTVAKLPDLRLKLEKVRAEAIVTLDSLPKQQPVEEEFPFLSPVPAAMQEVKLSELWQVDIDWKMLTLSRPNTRIEEDIFTRYVQLGRLRLNTMASECLGVFAKSGAPNQPGSKTSNRLKPGKGGTKHSRRRAGPDDSAGEDASAGEGSSQDCSAFSYDIFSRHAAIMDAQDPEAQDNLDADSREGSKTVAGKKQSQQRKATATTVEKTPEKQASKVPPGPDPTKTPKDGASSKQSTRKSRKGRMPSAKKSGKDKKSKRKGSKSKVRKESSGGKSKEPSPLRSHTLVVDVATTDAERSEESSPEDVKPRPLSSKKLPAAKRDTSKNKTATKKKSEGEKTKKVATKKSAPKKVKAKTSVGKGEKDKAKKK